MQEKPVLLTQKGLEKLREELDHLVNQRRTEIAQRIKTAKEFGDLTENAEYEDAKNEQGFVEGRILTLEQMIRNASLIETDDHSDGSVQLGSSVKVKDEFGEMTYTIVGPAEADAGSGRISLKSPLARHCWAAAPGTRSTSRHPGAPARSRSSRWRDSSHRQQAVRRWRRSSPSVDGRRSSCGGRGSLPGGWTSSPSLSCAEASRRVPAEPGQLGESASVAGRILGMRSSGGIAFADCSDDSGTLQLMATRELAGPDPWWTNWSNWTWVTSWGPRAHSPGPAGASRR